VSVLAGIDWPTVASLATAGGTLVLALATFASVRSANRSARVAEVALQEQRRPVVVQSRLDDPEQKIHFVDGHWVRVGGSGAVVEHENGNVYFAMSLRNVGAGIGVLQAWCPAAGINTSREHADEHEYRAQTRDLYIPAGDVGLWQGALRDPSEDLHAAIADAVDRREVITIELLYSDQVGGQRTITRFTVNPAGDDAWIAEVGRHWYLDREGPR
jgi:hypothetical protein